MTSDSGAQRGAPITAGAVGAEKAAEHTALLLRLLGNAGTALDYCLSEMPEKALLRPKVIATRAAITKATAPVDEIEGQVRSEPKASEPVPSSSNQAGEAELLAAVNRAVDWHNGDSENDDWLKIVSAMRALLAKYGE